MRGLGGILPDSRVEILAPRPSEYGSANTFQRE